MTFATAQVETCELYAKTPAVSRVVVVCSCDLPPLVLNLLRFLFPRPDSLDERFVRKPKDLNGQICLISLVLRPFLGVGEFVKPSARVAVVLA